MSSAEDDINRGTSGVDERRGEERHRSWTSSSREPAAIERELDATRADLRETLLALERRLSFDRLFELTVGRIREHGGEFAGNLGHAATQNPVPMLLTSVGLAWMMLESRRGNGSHYAATEPGSVDSMRGKMERARGKMGEMSGKLHEAMDSSRERMAHARDSVSGAAESVRSRASDAASATREQVERARASFENMLEEQPLVLGAIGLAAGALIGALLPESEAENRWLADTREKALRGAAHAARERAAARRGDERQSSAEEYPAQAAGRSADSPAAAERPQRPH